MVRQRFFVLFRRWAFTVVRVLGPVFGFEFFTVVRQHLDYAPVGILDVSAGALMCLVITAMLCFSWAWGEWLWSKLRKLRGFVREVRQCSRNYWSPEVVKTKKA